MTDIHDPSVRSFNMSRIRSKDTKPEVIVRKFLFKNGFRYRKHYKKIPGTPDVVLIGRKIIVDIKGCFWHRHENCRYVTTPKTNYDFYQKKFTDTIERDRKNKKYWIEYNWKVIEIWDCELKTAEKKESRLMKLLEEIIE